MPRRFRIRLRGRHKGIRWKKGTCASTNPPISVHRSKAPSICQTAYESTALTTMCDDDMKSSTAFTTCTNATFSRIGGTISRTKKNADLNNEIVAVLSSIAEVINGGTTEAGDSDTAYFACLLTYLESESLSELTTTAALYLLSLVIKKVNCVILQQRFDDLMTALTLVMKRFEKSEMALLLRSWIRCFSYTLKCQSPQVLADNTQHFLLLLRFLADGRHRVRKSCHIGVSAILNSIDDPRHPLIGLVCEHCRKQLDIAGFRDCSMISSILLLYRSVIRFMDRDNLLSCCESLLKLMANGDLEIRMQCLEVLLNLFQSDHSSIDMETNCKLINALYTCQPNAKEALTLAYWIMVMTAAHQCLFGISRKYGWLHLPRLARATVTALQNEREKIKEAAISSIEIQILHCIKPSIEEQSVDETALERWIGELCSAFSLKCHSSWLAVFKLFGDLLSVLTKPYWPFVKQYIGPLGRLRSGAGISQGTMENKEPNQDHQKQLNYAISNAFQTFGPEHVLSQIPMSFNSATNQFAPSWLVELMRKSIQRTKLQYFVQFFLPHALMLRKTCPDSPAECEIWSLFPGFCIAPTDPELFGQIARGIGVSLAKCSAIKIYILRGLINIIESAENDHTLSDLLQRDAKNFLPILFNIYTGEETPTDVRSLTQRTISQYCRFADAELVEVFFEKAMNKQQSESISSSARKLLLRLIACFVPVLSNENCGKVYELASNLIKSGSLQKRGYRLLQVLLECLNSSTYMKKKSEEISAMLRSTIGTVTGDAKRARFLCINAILDQCSLVDLICFFDETVLNVVGTNSRAIKAATELNASICRVLVGINDSYAETDMVFRLLEQINSATVVDQPSQHSRLCCAVALTYLVRHCKEHIVGNNARWLLNRVKCLLSEGKDNDQLFARSCILCSSLIKCLDPIVLLSSLDSLLRVLFLNYKKHSSRTRLRLRNVLRVMAKKIGFEVLSARMPSKDEKVVRMFRNLRKSINRADRKKAAKAKTVVNDSDSASDDGQAKLTKASRRSLRSKRNKVPRQDELWIDEADGEPLDLLDTKSINRLVYASDKTEKYEKIKGFNVDSKGRIVIRNEDEESMKEEDSSDDDIEDRFDTLSLASRKRGRKQRGDNNSDRKSMISDKTLHSGNAYKAKRAKGDVRKKNAPEPYAYIQLTTSLVNKRKKRQAGDLLKNAIKRAKIGAQKSARAGLKARKRQRM